MRLTITPMATSRRPGTCGSATPSTAWHWTSMLIRSNGGRLGLRDDVNAAASAGTLTLNIMRTRPIVSKMPMMPNGYDTA
jgi:hypothetical protein